jgi:hypothetical protein
VKTTFSRIIIIGDCYDAEKSGFHAGSRACVPFFFPGYSQNPIFKLPDESNEGYMYGYICKIYSCIFMLPNHDPGDCQTAGMAVTIISSRSGEATPPESDEVEDRSLP